MAGTWILVAANGRARLFERENRMSPLREIEEFANPEGRAHESELTSDLPGSAASRAGHHRVGAEGGFREHAVDRFASMLAGRLDEARKQGRCKGYILIASPKFLGLLRKHLTRETTRMIQNEIDKTLVARPVEEIQAQIDWDVPTKSRQRMERGDTPHSTRLNIARPS